MDRAYVEHDAENRWYQDVQRAERRQHAHVPYVCVAGEFQEKYVGAGVQDASQDREHTADIQVEYLKRLVAHRVKVDSDNAQTVEEQASLLVKALSRHDHEILRQSLACDNCADHDGRVIERGSEQHLHLNGSCRALGLSFRRQLSVSSIDLARCRAGQHAFVSCTSWLRMSGKSFFTNKHN